MGFRGNDATGSNSSIPESPAGLSVFSIFFELGGSEELAAVLALLRRTRFPVPVTPPPKVSLLPPGLLVTTMSSRFKVIGPFRTCFPHKN